MKKLLLFLLYIVCQLGFAQQDPQYNMYLFNQYIINPAYGGTRDAVAIVGSLRNQWSGFPGSPKTAYLSVHAPIKKYRLGYGLAAMNDRIGARNTSAAYGSVSYILPLSSKWKLSFGMRAGAINYQFNLDKTDYKDMNDNSFVQLNNFQKTVLDLDGGVYLYTRSFYFGMSVTHLNQARLLNSSYSIGGGTATIMYNLKSHGFFIIGKSFFINDNFLLNVNYLQQSVGSVWKGDLSVNSLIKKRVWLGIFARGGYGGGALMQIIVNKQLRIGYSFDKGGGVSSPLGNSHEIMIGWDIRPKNNTAVINPRFL
ncbi:MAG: PorP/SprF family type IX secretion system membrane protein [Bacteroidia bacterium]|nr:PorP/SprF family type IX secretion system membrane protein [Bacteroidia bacterium]